MSTYPILRSLLSPFRRSQQKTIATMVAVLLDVAQANSFAIATHLAQWTGIQVASALNRLYRLFRNYRIDDWLWTRQLLQLFVGRGTRILIAIDWTEWHSELRMLLGSVVVGKRAIPIAAATFHRHEIPRSQNTRENTFLRLLVAVLNGLGLKVVFLCDRGFRRVSWIHLLLQTGQGFVVRLQDDVHVHVNGRARKLRHWHLRPGGIADLGVVPLRSDGKLSVRVIGIWAPGQKEPWWLATDSHDPVPTIVAWYDRRMTIEEQIRDTKGCRFGLKLEWTHFQNPAHLNRFMLLLGTAIAIWTAVGAAAEERDPKVRIPSKTKGPRLSLPRVGVRFLRKIRSSAHLGVEFVRSYLPEPHLRTFAWLFQ